jgi:UDP-glucose 4-epimerase
MPAPVTRALVTGGAGFIGSHLVQSLLDREFEVTVLDDLSSGRRELVPEGAPLVEGSVSSNADLEKAFDPAPDYVLHLAALFANQKSVEHPAEDLRVNGGGTLNVLKLSAERGVSKVLNVSSSCVYADVPVMREDQLSFELDTPYAATKLLGEHYAKLFADLWDLDVVTIRPFNTYGPHEHPGPYRNVVPNFIRRAMDREPLVITGTGDESRDFTFVSDTVDGMVGALLGDTEAGSVFNIASGTETRIGELAERINALTGNDAGIELSPRRAWDNILRRRGDISRAKAAFGFEPTVTLDHGLERTYDWLSRIDA